MVKVYENSKKHFRVRKKISHPGETGVYKFDERSTQRPEHLLFSCYGFQCYKQVYQPVNKLNRYLISNVFEDKRLNSLTENPLRSALWCRNDANIARIFSLLAQNCLYHFLLHLMRCAIWYHFYNFKNVKNTRGGVLL